MLISPNKIMTKRILKNRTITFDSVKKTHGNLIFAPQSSFDEMLSVINSQLFRPSQLMSIFVPRTVKPMNRALVKIDQKEYYSTVKTKTNGKIKFGKISTQSYTGRNLLYDINTNYSKTLSIAKDVKHGRMLQSYMYELLINDIYNISKDADYENSFIIFPMIDYVEDFRRKVFIDIEVTDPMVLFLRAIKENKIDLTKLKKTRLVIFFNPKANAMLAIDLKDPDLQKDFQDYFLRIMRLNNYNNGSDSLEDDVDESEPVDDEDTAENKKEEIKNVVLKKVAKTLKANNLTDFEAANKNEKELILSIDDKIDKYLDDKDNLSKSFDELVDGIEKDPDIKKEAIKYVETKKISAQALNTLSKNIDKEVDVLSSITDLDTDDDINEPDVFEIDVPDMDPRIETSHMSSIDEQYTLKQNKKDLANVISSFQSSETLPITVSHVEIEDTSDDFNKKDTVRVRYKTVDGKGLSMTVDIPKVVDKRFLYLGGNKKVIKKQILRLPVVKTKADRVEITTNLNKMTIERTSRNISRKNAYLFKILPQLKDNKDIKIVYGINGVTNIKYHNDFEWEEVGNTVSSITTPTYKAYFNRDDIEKELDTLDIPDKTFDDDMTPFAIKYSGDEATEILYIIDSKVQSYNIAEHMSTPLDRDMFDVIIKDILNAEWALKKLPPIGNVYMYTQVTYLRETYPILALIGQSNGLTDILKRYHVKHYFSEKPKRNIDFVEVKFKDGFLYYEDLVKNNLLLDALYVLHTENYRYKDFDGGEPYTDYFISKFGQAVGMHSRTRLKINLDAMIDPITRDVLKDLHMPTDIVDILLYANTLLVGNSFRPLNDLRNYRIRANEIVNAILYKNIARAYIKYQEHKINGNPINLEIPKNCVIVEIQQQPNVNDHSALNPVREIEDVASASAKGFLGVNLNDAYTLSMRAYSDQMAGFLSGNAMPYSGQSGITRSMSLDPKITTVRGYIPDVNLDELTAANVLSPTELLSSFTSCGADPPRAQMQVAQTKHSMPVLHPSKSLIGSGVNKTLGFMISDDFCFKAKKSGFVEKIDKDNYLALLSYDDDTRDAIDLKEFLVKNSNSGFYIRQQFTMAYKEGERFKKGDVLAYNPQFFSGKGKNIDYLAGSLAKVAIASFDLSFEDATVVTEKLGKKCTSNICIMKDVILGKNAVVSNIVEEGQEVKTGDHLIDFTQSFDDPAIEKFLQNMSSADADAISNEHVSTKYSGQVTSIKIYYNVPFEQLSESLQKLITKYKHKISKRKIALEGINAESVHIPPLVQIKNDKVGNAKFEGVMIQFYVTYLDDLAMGDKITYQTALKGVVQKVIKDEESPRQEYRSEDPVEAILTPTGVIQRMTSDIYQMLYSNKVLIELGKQIKEVVESDE